MLWTFPWKVKSLLMLRFEPSLEAVQRAPEATLHQGLDSTVLASSWTFPNSNMLLIPRT